MNQNEQLPPNETEQQNKLITELAQIRERAYLTDPKGTHEKVLAKVDELEKRFGDKLVKSHLYHSILADSGEMYPIPQPDEKTPEIDKEIESFVRTLKIPSPEEGREKLINELRQILNKTREKMGDFAVHDAILKKTEEWKNEFGGDIVNQSRLYHILIGSSEPGTVLDIDGKIEAFIRGLAKKE